MTVRRGFTLVEMMVAASIFSLVAGGAVVAFLGIERMSRRAVAEAELSIRSRELRDKLLFHQTETVAGKVSTGLLSGNAFDPSALAASRWLNPAGLADADSAAVSDTGNPSQLYFVDLTLTADRGGRFEVSRTERLAVPVFGALQATPEGKGSVFGD